MMQPVATDFVIRSCESLAEFEACVELRCLVWGYSDADLAPIPILIVARKTGGHVVGTFDEERREHRLCHGVNLIEWTFDPLEIKNAWLNIVRLGIIRKFIPNLYGLSRSRLHGNLPTDCLIAQWHLHSPRVKATLAGDAPQPAATAVRSSLPVDIGRMRQDDPDAARRIQAHLRREFEHQFYRGHAVTGFQIEEANATYLLEPYED
jgi:predicted GNAT superfamily acetyltransferase